jgi:hypothetical protein
MDSITQTVANAAECLDERLPAWAFHLSAQQIDEDINNVGQCVPRFLPHIFAQHVAGDDPVLVLEQVVQQFKFTECQGNLLTAATYATLQEIHFQIVGVQDGFAFTASAPQ